MRKPKPINLPSCVRIAGVEWTVSYRTTPTESDAATRGKTDENQQEIWVDGGQSRVGQRKTLLHELLHAVGDTFSTKTELKEVQVVALENGLWALFMDNPGLADELFRQGE